MLLHFASKIPFFARNIKSRFRITYTLRLFAKSVNRVNQEKKIYGKGMQGSWSEMMEPVDYFSYVLSEQTLFFRKAALVLAAKAFLLSASADSFFGSAGTAGFLTSPETVFLVSADTACFFSFCRNIDTFSSHKRKPQIGSVMEQWC